MHKQQSQEDVSPSESLPSDNNDDIEHDASLSDDIFAAEDQREFGDKKEKDMADAEKNDYPSKFPFTGSRKDNKKKKTGNLNYKYQANLTHKFLRRIGIDPSQHRITYGMISSKTESELEREIACMKRKYCNDVQDMIQNYDENQWTNINIYTWKCDDADQDDDVYVTMLHGYHYYNHSDAKQAYEQSGRNCKHCINHQKLERKIRQARRKRELHPFYSRKEPNV